MDTVTITINGKKITVPKDYTVMQAAEELGIEIPRLCFLKDINETSACRLCVVDVKKMRGLKNSCTLAVDDGMDIQTNSQDIHDSIVSNLQLLASNHVFECWACERETSCELLDLMRRYNVENVYGENQFYDRKERKLNDTSSSIVLDSGKCVLCGRCITTCEKETGLGILAFNERGNGTYVGPANFHSMADSGCINCGKCIEACPVAAIKEASHIDQVMEALRNPNKKVIVAPSTSLAVTLGEEFGTSIGENVEGKLYASLEKLGFKEIMNMDFATNLNVLETASELLTRVKTKKDLPLFSSSSPAWVSYVEQYEPDSLSLLSHAKSPQQIAGALTKHYFAEKLGYDKEDVVFVTIMPTVANKDEASRAENSYQGIRDVDYVLTAREYARLLKRKGIHFLQLDDIKPFGSLAELTNTTTKSYTGGTLSAILKTASELSEEQPQDIKFKASRGVEGVMEATYHVAGQDLNVALVHNTNLFNDFFKHMKKSKKQYHFVECMTTTNDTIDGGGQPIHSAQTQDNVDITGTRIAALEAMQEGKPESDKQVLDSVQSLYKEYFSEPGSDVSKTLLHTSFHLKKFYK